MRFQMQFVVLAVAFISAQAFPVALSNNIDQAPGLQATTLELRVLVSPENAKITSNQQSVAARASDLQTESQATSSPPQAAGLTGLQSQSQNGPRSLLQGVGEIVDGIKDMAGGKFKNNSQVCQESLVCGE